MKPPLLRLALALLAAALVVAVALAALSVSPRDAAAWVEGWRAAAQARPAWAAGVYFAFYVAFAALSAPGAWIVSVAGGALFGPWRGIPLVALSATAGATTAMLAARYLAREWVAARFPEFVARVDRGVARDGARWLFAARLTPLVPYFAVNLAAGLTRMPAATFLLVSLAGSLPLATLYVLAGAGLAHIERPGDVLNAPALAALFGLAAAPFAWRFVRRWRGSRPRIPA